MAVLVAAEDYTHGKPAPEPYAQAIARLGVDAARSIAIEDATPGILSARAAGARVIAVRAGNFAGYDLSAADVVVDTLDDITDDVCARLLRVKVDPATLSSDDAYAWQVGDHPAAPDRLDVDAERRRLGEPGAVLVLHGRLVRSADLPHLRGAPRNGSPTAIAPAQGHLAQHRTHGRIRHPRRQRRARDIR